MVSAPTAAGAGTGLAVLAQPVKVELDGLPHEQHALVIGAGRRDDAGQVGSPCAVPARLVALDDGEVARHWGQPVRPRRE